MGKPADSLSRSPTVMAAAPGFPPSGKTNIKRTIITNVVVAFSAVALYQGVRTLISLPQNPVRAEPAVSPSADLDRRSEIVERAPGDGIWDQITPSRTLEWHECYQSMKCARLEVPLDYWNGTANGTATLAIAMMPAKVPITDPRYGGPLLLNQGGPGAPGTSFIVGAGETLQRMVDTPGKPSLTEDNQDARYFDLVGIDPRGVAFSMPQAKCFNTGTEAAEWNLRQVSAGVPGWSNNTLVDLWGIDQAYGQSCHRFTTGKGPADNIIPYVSTASTARDMITFIDRYAEWRAAECKRMLKGQVPERLQDSGPEKLQYWGFSYGTFLGETFASMFPERTGRLILDGVADAEDYIHARFTDVAVDAEKTMDWFYSSCADAGPKKCALAAKAGSTAKDVRERVEALLHKLRREPVVGAGSLPELVTWSQVKTTIAHGLYSPADWASMAETLASFESDQPVPLGAAALQTNYPGGRTGNEWDHFTLDAQTAVTCEDAFPMAADYGLDDIQAHYQRLLEISPTMAPLFYSLPLLCAAWKQQGKYSFRGPFGASADSGVAPILFIGNTADPATPLPSARKMAAIYAGSRVLQHDSPGHTSLMLSSACTIRHLRAYLQTGQLPKEGQVCKPDELPFGEPSPDLPRSADALDDPNVSAEDEDAALIATAQKIRSLDYRKPGSRRGVV